MNDTTVLRVVSGMKESKACRKASSAWAGRRRLAANSAVSVRSPSSWVTTPCDQVFTEGRVQELVSLQLGVVASGLCLVNEPEPAEHHLRGAEPRTQPG